MNKLILKTEREMAMSPKVADKPQLARTDTKRTFAMKKAMLWLIKRTEQRMEDEANGVVKKEVLRPLKRSKTSAASAFEKKEEEKPELRKFKPGKNISSDVKPESSVEEKPKIERKKTLIGGGVF